MSISAKIVGFLGKSNKEKAHALRSRFIQASVGLFGARFFSKGQTFLAYHPDSYVYSPSHPEFYTLFEKFTANNELNNGGDSTRLWALILNIKQIQEEKIPGDFAELGVWRGNTAAVLAFYAQKLNRDSLFFDTFEGFDKKDIVGVDEKETANHFSDTSVELVKSVVGKELNNCHYIKGYFPESINEIARNRQYSVVNLDCDLYKPMKAALEFFYPRMSRGGILFLHDYSSPFWDGAKKAVDEFCVESGEFAILLPDKSGSAVIRKTKT